MPFDSFICPVEGDTILSPAVGLFIPNVSGVGDIGKLRRLGKDYRLTVYGDVKFQCAFLSPQNVAVGDCLARCLRLTETSSSLSQPQLTVASPVDGYLSCLDDNGNPLRTPGERIEPHAILGYVEFMKIRVDLTYDGNVPVIFESYRGVLTRAVHVGDIIAELKPIG